MQASEQFPKACIVLDYRRWLKSPAQEDPRPSQPYWVMKQSLPGDKGVSSTLSEANSDTLSPKVKTLGLEFIVEHLAGLEPSV